MNSLSNSVPQPPTWNQVARQLLPFVRRRVPSDSDAQDILQEILMKLHKSLPTLRDDARLTSWMYSVARNAIVDHLRRGARLGHWQPNSEIQQDELAGDDAVARELAQHLAGFVDRLPSPYREAIVLTELEGRSQQEAADLMGISLSGMKSRVQRGRAKLREMLEACCEIALDARGKVIQCEPRSNPKGCCGNS